MLQLNGIPQTQITGNILGKISREVVGITKRHDYVFLTNGKNPRRRYAAILTLQPLKNPKTVTLLCTEEQLQGLNDGDIVSIDTNGKITILYEKKSHHNSLLVTERCNCTCVMCPQSINNLEADKTPLTLRIISLIDKDAQVLGITGGEPTLLGDRLIEIIRACKERLPCTKLILLSNGIRFEDFDYVKTLMLVQHPDLTIDIPLYSDIDTEHNKIIKAKGFYRTVNGLYNLARFNQRIGIRVVLHKLTYKRLPQLAEFLYHNFPFVFHIAFMQMETINLARENIELLWIDPHDYNSQLEEAVFYLWRRGMNVSVYNAQLCVLPKSLWRFARKSISNWKNIYLEECSKCNLCDDCGGLFQSSADLHSSHIRPLSSPSNVTNIKTIGTDPSATLLKYLDHILTVRGYPVLDVPCGFGRHSFLLASRGCKVICTDINQKALDYISEYQKTCRFEKGLVTLRTDLERDNWRFARESLGAIINVHYYRYNLLDNFMASLIKGGFLYIETPGGQGGNYVDLPAKGIIRAKLEPYFKILYYREKEAGPIGSSRVTLEVFAQKLR